MSCRLLIFSCTLALSNVTEMHAFLMLSSVYIKLKSVAEGGAAMFNAEPFMIVVFMSSMSKHGADHTFEMTLAS